MDIEKKTLKFPQKRHYGRFSCGGGEVNACMDESYPLDHEQESDSARGDSHDPTDP
jgi:hypothetical protein